MESTHFPFTDAPRPGGTEDKINGSMMKSTKVLGGGVVTQAGVRIGWGCDHSMGVRIE